MGTPEIVVLKQLESWGPRRPRDGKNPSENQLPRVQSKNTILAEKAQHRGQQASLSRKEHGGLTSAGGSEGGSGARGLARPATSARKKRDKSHQWGLGESEAAFFSLGGRAGWREGVEGGGRRAVKGFESSVCREGGARQPLPPFKAEGGGRALTLSAALRDEKDQGQQQQRQ